LTVARGDFRAEIQSPDSGVRNPGVERATRSLAKLLDVLYISLTLTTMRVPVVLVVQLMIDRKDR
jgi:hypothetical protein